MSRIKFGTDGWRAIIARDFTVDNVARVASATSKWLLKHFKNPSAVIGYDCRFGGKLFSETIAEIFAINGIKVFISGDFISTPAISLGILNLKSNIGVIITASHNPYEYNGFKLKGQHGGPLLEENIKEIEALIPEENEIHLENIKWEELIKSKIIQYVDFEDMYVEHVKTNLNLNLIKKSGFNFAFDAMYGAGQKIMKKILPDIKMIHCEHNPTFNNIPPEPLLRNLYEFSEMIRSSKTIDCGLAVDGDADRLALLDNKGNYIDSHHIILLLIHYLAKYKGLKGKIVTGFSSTVKVEKLSNHYGLKVQRVKIGFKDICKVIMNEDVLLGGEESGGIAIKTHIPERDGIWMGLTIWQFMAETGRSLDELLEEVYKITGTFAFERRDLKIDEQTKKNIIEKCKRNIFRTFGKYKVERVEDMDGYKYFFTDDEWLMIRPSGTEPVLRIYSESTASEKAKDILDEAYKILMAVN